MKLYPSSLFIALLAIVSCSDDKDEVMVEPTTSATIVKEWTVPMSTENENPAPWGQGATGRVEIQLYSDNSLKYILFVNGAVDDKFVDVNLYAGDVISNGPVILPFEPIFAGNTATGTITGLRQSLVDSLKSDANDIYINIQTKKVSSGLVRGQLNKTLDFVKDVEMSCFDVIPPLETEQTGLAIFRLTTDKKLYLKINVANTEPLENWTSASIHLGGVGTNGAVLMRVYGTGSEFGTVKVIPVDDDFIYKLKNDFLYITASSIEHPDGGVRGDIYHW